MVSLIRRGEREQEPRRQIARRDPFQMLKGFLREPFAMSPFDFDVPLREIESMLPARVFSPDVEVRETNDRYMFSVDLPGVNEKDVEVSVSGNRMTISGRREEEREEGEEGSQYHVYERSYGSFTRSFVLPEGTNLEGVKADLKNGVLQIEVPKQVSAASKQIPIGGVEKKPEERKGAEKKPEEQPQKQPKAA